MKPGDKVIILKSRYADVDVGKIGTVDCSTHGGVGVQIEGDFIVSGTNPTRVTEKRVFWFRKTEVSKQ